MAIPQRTKRFHEMDRVERSEEAFANKASVTYMDLVSVAITAQVEMGIDRYRMEAEALKQKELRSEEHQSARLAKHLEECGDPRPNDKCHAHAIVSGHHRNAAPMRAILARHKIRIDDAYNGCWLPENTAALAHMPDRLKNAIPHSRIHRYNYYFWLGTMINLNKTPAPDDLKYTLKTIGLQVQAGAQPDYVMLKKGEGIDA